MSGLKDAARRIGMFLSSLNQLVQADRGEAVDWNAEEIWAEVERCCAAEQRKSDN